MGPVGSDWLEMRVPWIARDFAIAAALVALLQNVGRREESALGASMQEVFRAETVPRHVVRMVSHGFL